jgi:hypothetical protein
MLMKAVQQGPAAVEGMLWVVMLNKVCRNHCFKRQQGAVDRR